MNTKLFIAFFSILVASTEHLIGADIGDTSKPVDIEKVTSGLFFLTVDVQPTGEDTFIYNLNVTLSSKKVPKNSQKILPDEVDFYLWVESVGKFIASARVRTTFDPQKGEGFTVEFKDLNIDPKKKEKIRFRVGVSSPHREIFSKYLNADPVANIKMEAVGASMTTDSVIRPVRFGTKKKQ